MLTLRTSLGGEVHQVGVLAQDEEGIAHEGRGVFLGFGNVVKTACGHGGLAVRDGAVTHDHAFGQMADLPVLVLKGFDAQPPQIGHIGHVVRWFQSVGAFRGSGRAKAQAGGTQERTDDSGKLPSMLLSHTGFLATKSLGAGC